MNHRNHSRHSLRQGDFLLLALCIIASVYGILLIASASNYRDNTRYILIQSVALVVGIVLYFVCSKIDIQLLTEKWIWILIFNVLLISSLIFLGWTGALATEAGFGSLFFQLAFSRQKLQKLHLRSS